MIYDLLAPIYDKINGDIDYRSWADFFEKIFSREMKNAPELVLDLGCGTGKMTVELAKRGYDMTGVDYSDDMLAAAREYAISEGVSDKMLWLSQDIRAFELYGTVDAAVACLDTMNHLTTREDFMACLKLVRNYLIPDGVFIFDINGKYKFENIYADRSYVMEEEGAVCVWQNDYNPKTHKCGFYITLFEELPDGNYERTDEVQEERMYTLRSIKKMLADASLEFIGAYADFAFTAADDNSERIYVVARCKKPFDYGCQSKGNNNE